MQKHTNLKLDTSHFANAEQIVYSNNLNLFNRPVLYLGSTPLAQIGQGSEHREKGRETVLIANSSTTPHTCSRANKTHSYKTLKNSDPQTIISKPNRKTHWAFYHWIWCIECTTCIHFSRHPLNRYMYTSEKMLAHSRSHIKL